MIKNLVIEEKNGKKNLINLELHTTLCCTDTQLLQVLAIRKTVSKMTKV